MHVVPGEPFDIPPEALGRIPLFAELAKVLSWSGGPVNWDLARQIAVATAASGAASTDPAQAEVEELTEDARLAELWLAEATGLEAPSTLARLHATSAAGWAEAAPDGLRELIDPLAAKVARAMSEQSLPASEEAQAGAMAQALAQLAPLFLGVQAGVVIGALARSVLGGHDVPLPMGEGAISIVVPTVDAFARDYRLDQRQARLWVVLHESAHRLELEGLPWVRPHFFALYHNYVAAVDVDLSDAIARLQGMDLTDLERLQDQLDSQGFFGLLDSPATATALERIQHLLALLEAFADQAALAAGARLPDAARIAEALARRRAESEGPALLAKFTGLDVPAGRVRDADQFCRGVLEQHGWAALNRMWDEPDALPSADELGDAASWVARVGVTR